MLTRRAFLMVVCAAVSPQVFAFTPAPSKIELTARGEKTDQSLLVEIEEAITRIGFVRSDIYSLKEGKGVPLLEDEIGTSILLRYQGGSRIRVFVRVVWGERQARLTFYEGTKQITDEGRRLVEAIAAELKHLSYDVSVAEDQ